MLQNNELKSVFVEFCKQRKEQYDLNEKSYLKLVEKVFIIYEKLISNEEYVYLNLLESMLSFELYQYVLIFKYSIISNNYNSHFWNYSVYQGIITQNDILECIGFGLEFDYEPQDDYFYDYEYDSHIYSDTLFKNKGSKEKQYYIIQRSNK